MWLKRINFINLSFYTFKMEVRLSTALAMAEGLDDLRVFEEDETHRYTLVHGRTEVGSITPLNRKANKDLNAIPQEEVIVNYKVNLKLLSDLKRKDFERNYR